MADEPRRSGRATKGQHPKNLDLPAAASKSSQSKSKRSAKDNSSKATLDADDDDSDAIIRCICGADAEDSDDERMMICCDQCLSWQHNECMEITEDEDALPDKYLCERCSPASHKMLLQKVARGERPWEERIKERQRQEQQKKDRKKRPGKKGKGGRKSKLSETKSEASEQVDEDTVLNEEPRPEDKATPTIATRQKSIEPDSIKSQDAEVGSVKKRKASGGSAEGQVQDMEPQTKVRKVSAPTVKKEVKPASPRVAKEPAKRDAKDSNQTELVTSVDQLQNSVRRTSANSIVTTLEGLIARAQNEGSYQIPEGATNTSEATRIALETEHAVHLHHSNVPGDPTAAYRQRLRSMLFNLKKNATLRDRLLQGSLTADKFSTMSSDEMASKEMQERDAEMRKEAERQHTLIREEGPRIRRTHKGEEIVGGEQEQGEGHESIFSSAPPRRRESAREADTPSAMSPSVGAMSPTTPFSTTFPESRRMSDSAGPGSLSVGPPSTAENNNDPMNANASVSGSATRSEPTPFNIQDVWSSVRESDVERQRSARRPPRPMVTESMEVEMGDAGDDPEIDQLLKDEEMESPPYSPTDYASDPSVVWRGKLSMTGVAEFHGSAKHVGGADMSATLPWSELMPQDLRMEGRIDSENADKYLCELRWSRSTDVILVAISPTGGKEAHDEFDRLWTYFYSRNKWGVIDKSPLQSVRDAYVIPIGSGMARLPLFMELIQDIRVEGPRSENMILIIFVLRRRNSPEPMMGVEAGGRLHTDAGPTASPSQSPFSAQPGVVGRVPPPAHALASPISPYITTMTPISNNNNNNNNNNAHATGSNGTGHDGSSSQMMQPPPAPPAAATTAGGNNNNTTAAQILGRFIDSTVVRQLLTESPDIGAVQLTVIREILERVPAAGDDFGLLSQLLVEKSRAEGR